MATSNQKQHTVKNDNPDDMDDIQKDKDVNPPATISNWEKIAGLIFGVTFVTALLALSVFIPDPSPTQYATFKTILAMAAAGIGGILAGTIHVKGSIQKWSVRAGGAIALFIIVFFFTPTMPEDGDNIHQVIHGDKGTQIGTNTGVINIGTSDPKQKND